MAGDLNDDEGRATAQPPPGKPKWSGLGFLIGLVVESLVLFFGFVGWFMLSYGGSDAMAVFAGIAYGVAVLGILAAGITSGIRKRRWAFAQGALAAFIATPLTVMLCSALMN